MDHCRFTHTFSEMNMWTRWKKQSVEVSSTLYVQISHTICEWISFLVLNVPSCLLWHAVFGRSCCNLVLEFDFFVIHFFRSQDDAFANKWVESKRNKSYAPYETRAKYSQVKQSRIKWSDEWNTYVRSHTHTRSAYTRRVPSVCLVFFSFVCIYSARVSDVSVKTQCMRIACQVAMWKHKPFADVSHTYVVYVDVHAHRRCSMFDITERRWYRTGDASNRDADRVRERKNKRDYTYTRIHTHMKTRHSMLCSESRQQQKTVCVNVRLLCTQAVFYAAYMHTHRVVH